MITTLPRALVVSALFATVPLLGATTPDGGSMYLRAPNLQGAPVVRSLDYDAVATVPARPHTPASLLPVDRVEGALIIPSGTTTTSSVDRSRLSGISTFTVVQVDANGVVVQRTIFRGVSILAVATIGTGDGNMAQRVTFGAADVHVTTPAANLAQR